MRARDWSWAAHGLLVLPAVGIALLDWAARHDQISGWSGPVVARYVANAGPERRTLGDPSSRQQRRAAPGRRGRF